MKEKAKADGKSVGLDNLGRIMQNELDKVANKIAFFKDSDVYVG